MISLLHLDPCCYGTNDAPQTAAVVFQAVKLTAPMLNAGEGILQDVQLRVEAFEYLQLPFVIKEGSVGRLKLQVHDGQR